MASVGGDDTNWWPFLFLDANSLARRDGTPPMFGADETSSLPIAANLNTSSDLCRKHGISDATSYKWRAQYGGMDVSDAKTLKALEDENSNPDILKSFQRCLPSIHAV